MVLTLIWKQNKMGMLCNGFNIDMEAKALMRIFLERMMKFIL